MNLSGLNDTEKVKLGYKYNIIQIYPYQPYFPNLKVCIFAAAAKQVECYLFNFY